MLRRARPLLGTLVEVGAPAGHEAAFEIISALQAQLSRFVPDSDIARFNAMPAGGELAVGQFAVDVLSAARKLHIDSEGLFDVSLDTGPDDWHLDGLRLCKLTANVTLDLGGIAKGYAVDVAVRALQADGIAMGWINAGGDLRVFGDLELPLRVRDEQDGRSRQFAALSDGAFATSHFAPNSRSALSPPCTAHVSVAAPTCLWADALTKVVALSGRVDHPLVARYDAAAWRHDRSPDLP
ncbi:MAG: FAD:protein FMN transferase [Burkholderiales bacterium]|nr:FAD:protein FMN transferase [Burkholderiales bacterium]